MLNKLLLSLCLFFSILNAPIHAQGICITGSDAAAEGAFAVGYKATFETLGNGTDVQVTFELYDTDKIGLVAFLQRESPFEETQMTFVSGQTWNTTLVGLTPGDTISYRCKFAFAGGLSTTQYIQYEVDTDCTGSTNDESAPDSFTASVGTTTPISVELLLNANDNSGTVAYLASFNGITRAVSSPSGVQKSFIIPGLDPSTSYNFSVSAIDLSGNAASNNPISISGSTTEDTNTPCAGISNEAQQGAFEIGYNYNFETQANGSDVNFTFELLDDRPYGNVFLWRESPFLETPMTETGSGTKIFTSTETQIPGDTISYACKFEFSPGLGVTRYFSYIVGDDCSLTSINELDLSSVSVFPNPTKEGWNISMQNETIMSIEVFSTLGERVMSLSPNGLDATIPGVNLGSGLYFARIETANSRGTIKLIKE